MSPERRPPERPRSIQGRLVWRTLLSVGLLWLAAAAYTWWDARHELGELLDAHLAQSAALLVAQQTPGADDDDHQAPDAPLLHRYARHVAFQVWHEGRLVLHSPNATGAALATLDDGFTDIVREGEPWRLFAARGAHDDVQVFVAERADARDEILFAVLRGALGPLLLVLPLVALSVWWSVRRGLQPLRELDDTLHARSPAALEPLRLRAPTPAELQAPLDALNRLFERIGRLLEGERRFTADAAHELRTPIAAVRAQAQVALGATDDAERRHALQATLAGCDRATHLVQQLLTLARLEGHDALRPALPLDLAALARRVVAELVPAALARHQTLALDARDACPLAADDALCSMLVRNLVDNALRHSPDGATVQLLLQPEAGGGVLLVVEDSGPGLDEAEQARLGERFFRAAGAGSGGSGLGWSIVRRIAEAQGARIALGRSATLGGLSVRVAWARP